MADLGERLAARTLELVDIPSQSGHEDAIRERVHALVPSALRPETVHEDAALFLPERRDGVPLVLLACHYDTVPAQDNLPGAIRDGSVHGLGASDMKGGLAVALELVRDLAETPGRLDVGLLVFGKEELPREHDPLPALLTQSVAAPEVALAILLEPTDGEIHAGCLGNLIARLTFRGVSGHSARPWDAENAIERAIEGLAPLVTHERRPVEVGGLTFSEVLSVTRLQAGIADNVIPDRADAHLNFRYAPDRSSQEAEAYLRAVVPADAELVIIGDAPSGRVVTASPLVAELAACGAHGVAPKQAWTNVADFSEAGIDAVNFGPGHTRYAHRRDELVEITALVHAYETLRRLVAG